MYELTVFSYISEYYGFMDTTELYIQYIVANYGIRS